MLTRHRRMTRQAHSAGPNAKTPGTHWADRVLVALLAEIEALAEMDSRLETAPDVKLASLVRVGIPYRPDVWLPQADRQVCSRATRRLERHGLLRPIGVYTWRRNSSRKPLNLLGTFGV